MLHRCFSMLPFIDWLWTSFLWCFFRRSRFPLRNESADSDVPPEHETKEPITCNCRPEHEARNLVVCFDGTSYQFGRKNTNVVELFSRLVKDDKQLAYYSGGIGTYSEPQWKTWRYYQRVVYSWIDIAIAWTFDRSLLKAYKWLSENYEPGDRVFVFGLSRGGYLARALAGMIHEVGLLYKGDDDQISFAYQLYAGTKKFRDVRKTREEFKKTFCRQHVCVHFAGLWDCVSAVGFGRGDPLPSTANGLKSICYVRHALALNEVRVKFQADYIRGGDGPTEADVEGQRPHVKEVWFAGSQPDVGGGYLDNESNDRFNPALRWITQEASEAGLRFRNIPEKWKDQPPHNALYTKWFWRVLECLPITHWSYTDKHPLVYFRPHWGQPRKIRPRQRIHTTAFSVRDEKVVAKLTWPDLPRGMDWKDLRQTDYNDLVSLPLIERDKYTDSCYVASPVESSDHPPSYAS